MDNYETFHDILVVMFNDIMTIEERALITEEFSDLTNNDMHVIEAIGIGTPKNMSAIAKQLEVTVGTLTISMNSLVKKGYVTRERSEHDRRVVYIRLTAKGKKAFAHHARFHKEMIDTILNGLTEEETRVLVKALTNFKAFFREWKEKSR